MVTEWLSSPPTYGFSVRFPKKVKWYCLGDIWFTSEIYTTPSLPFEKFSTHNVFSLGRYFWYRYIYFFSWKFFFCFQVYNNNNHKLHTIISSITKMIKKAKIRYMCMACNLISILNYACMHFKDIWTLEVTGKMIFKSSGGG